MCNLYLLGNSPNTHAQILVGGVSNSSLKIGQACGADAESEICVY